MAKKRARGVVNCSDRVKHTILLLQASLDHLMSQEEIATKLANNHFQTSINPNFNNLPIRLKVSTTHSKNTFTFNKSALSQRKLMNKDNLSEFECF